MELFILRHGLAGSREEWVGRDAERPLTDKGRARSREVARGLARLGVAPDVIVTSPFLRAAETAHLTAAALNAPVVETHALEPGVLRQEYRLLLQPYDDGASVMLVGHEPDLSDFIGMLIAGPARARVDLKKGACARLLVDAAALVAQRGGEAPVATLEWLMTAKSLAYIAGSNH
jgi:phosphohistidine phosphatase